MITKKLLFAFSLFLSTAFTNVSLAQTPVQLHVEHKLGNNAFAFSQTTQNDLGNDFNVTRLEYYMSQISITHDGGMITNIPNHYILVNASQNLVENLGSYNITTVESISFYIGVDSVINHLDPSLQPAGHPLEPKSPSMHWGWAAGYRFVAMEGQSGTGLSQNYEIHALGDKNYLKTTIFVNGVNQNGKLIIPLKADYTKALKGIDVSSGVVAHGDNATEAKLLGNFNRQVFSQGIVLDVNNTITSSHEIAIYPNPSANGNFTISFSLAASAQFIVHDLTGRVMQKSSINNSEKADIRMDVPGFYVLDIVMDNGHVITKKLVVE